MDTFGQIIREHRLHKRLRLQDVALALRMDIALLSKMERNRRKPSKEQIGVFSDYYGISYEILLLAWLSDKIVCEIKNEQVALEALKLAEQKINHEKENSK